MSTYFGFAAYDVDNYSDPFVFISYKSEDCDRVAVYAKYLHDHGLNVWYDYGLHVGTDWENYLMKVIAKPNCKTVLLFVSAMVGESSVIPLETTRARQCKKPTVAVYLEPGLSLGRLLGEAIDVYVSQRQSIDAFAGSEETVCSQVLAAAKNAMEDKPTAESNFTDESKLWNNALLFIRNAERSQNEGDIEKARGFLKQITSRNPTDYRGWLGLAMCECVSPVKNLDSALELLKKASGYYSYVVAAGADSTASGEYTRIKSYLWQRVLDVMQSESKSCTASADLQALLLKLAPFATFFGHTEDYIKNSYDGLVLNVSNHLQELDAKAAEEARIEAEARRFFSCCEWKPITDTEVRLKKYNGEFTEYIIPECVDGARVTEIGKEAFKEVEFLTSITIPDSVTSIGEWAFTSCTGLTNITIPDSVTTISEGAFWHCAKLTSITIPNSVTYIGKYAFGNCVELTNIEVDKNNKNYKSVNGVLFAATENKLVRFPVGRNGKYTIPYSITSIGSGAFHGCENLTSIAIPHGVTSIGSEAFCGCENLISITIPRSVTSIGSQAFKGCTELTKIIIPNRVTTIKFGAFDGCTELTGITIPRGVTSIDSHAFHNCKALTQITIPNGVTNIGTWAFSGCTGLAKITIPDSVTSIGSGAFSGCTGLAKITIPDSVAEIGDNAFSGCTGLTKISLPDSVTSIGRNAFSCCGNLTKITISNNVTEIGNEAFLLCENLVSITVPDGVATIGNEAFSFCTSLTCITIPDSVTDIGNGAFKECPDLTVNCSTKSYAWKYCEENNIPHAPAKTGLFSKLFG